jgi:hypothetical protein
VECGAFQKRFQKRKKELIMPARQAVPCFKCNEVIEVSHAAFMVDVMLRFVGIPRVIESARFAQASVGSCVTCTNFLANGDEPNPKLRPLDHVVYQLMQEAIANDPTYAFLNWLELRKARNMPVARLDDAATMRILETVKKRFALPEASTIEQDGDGKLVKLAG